MHDYKVSKWPGPQLPPPDENRFEYALRMALERRVTENEANMQRRHRAYGEFRSSTRSWGSAYD